MEQKYWRGILGIVVALMMLLPMMALNVQAIPGDNFAYFAGDLFPNDTIKISYVRVNNYGLTAKLYDPTNTLKMTWSLPKGTGSKYYSFTNGEPGTWRLESISEGLKTIDYANVYMRISRSYEPDISGHISGCQPLKFTTYLGSTARFAVGLDLFEQNDGNGYKSLKFGLTSRYENVVFAPTPERQVIYYIQKLPSLTDFLTTYQGTPNTMKAMFEMDVNDWGSNNISTPSGLPFWYQIVAEGLEGGALELATCVILGGEIALPVLFAAGSQLLISTLKADSTPYTPTNSDLGYTNNAEFRWEYQGVNNWQTAETFNTIELGLYNTSPIGLFQINTIVFVNNPPGYIQYSPPPLIIMIY